MKPRDPLDTILLEWHSRHAGVRTARRDAEERLRLRLSDERFLHVPGHDGTTRRRRHLRLPVGLAAALLAALSVLLLRSPPPRQEPVMSAFTPAELKARALRYQAVSELFGGHVRRLDLSGGGMNIVLEPGGGDLPARLLVMRLVAFEQDKDGRWTPAWSREGIVREQDVLPVALPRPEGGKLEIWTLPLSGNRVYVESFLAGPPSDLGAPNSRLLTSGQPVELLRLPTSRGTCRVYQTVDWLPLAPADGSSA